MDYSEDNFQLADVGILLFFFSSLIFFSTGGYAPSGPFFILSFLEVYVEADILMLILIDRL